MFIMKFRVNLDGKKINDLSKEFLKNYPFEHLSINNFLDEKNAKKILEEIKKEDFYTEEHDLYKFDRTVDLRNSDNQYLLSFREYLLSEEFISIIEKITNVQVKRGKIELHSLKLFDTDYLLCHDDQVQDRKIAFILNLSSNWEDKYGGNLELFDSSSDNKPTKVVKKIVPQFNQFNIFKVTPRSYHQISEVEGEHERISISGWYY